MRRTRLLSLEAAMARAEPVNPGSMEMHVRTHGVSAAAWLVWAHRCADADRGEGWQMRSRNMRAGLRELGVVDLNIPSKERTPPWFLVAIETLKRRKGWTVQIVGRAHGAQRVYRIRWLGHGTFGGGNAKQEPSKVRVA